MSQGAITDAAKRYAKVWMDLEKPLARDLGAADRATRLDALQRCAGHFRIARNFGTSFDIGRGIPRLDPVLSIIDPLRAPLRADQLFDVVELTSQRLAGAYGKRGLLSAATKLLWLIHKDPVIIYDSQVRAALRVPSGDYRCYVSRWHSLYSRHASGVRTATSLMRGSGAPFDREWFRRRVFDMYLWAKGAPW